MIRGTAIGATLVVAVLAAVIPAHAEDYGACMKAADAVDPKMFACQDQELDRQNRALNRVYATLLDKLKTDPETAAKLRRAEHAWITFRDADCAVLDYGTKDGTLDRIVLNDCIIGKTKTRTAELDTLGKSPDLNKNQE